MQNDKEFGPFNSPKEFLDFLLSDKSSMIEPSAKQELYNEVRSKMEKDESIESVTIRMVTDDDGNVEGVAGKYKNRNNSPKEVKHKEYGELILNKLEEISKDLKGLIDQEKYRSNTLSKIFMDYADKIDIYTKKIDEALTTKKQD